MKRIFTFLSLAALPVLASAQSQRVVLVEHFTQASCGPCATYNPPFNNLINNNPNTVVSIKYQTSWPGVDPMNAHNPSEVQTRVSYYGVNSVPRGVIDGNYYNGNPGNINQNHFNNRAAVTSPFTINLTNAVNNGGDSINVTAVVTKTGNTAPAAALKLHIGVIERDIWFPVAPGSNGEKHFMSVMKKMLPNASGTTLAAMNVGDVATFSYSWKLANIYDMSQLAAVAFIQENSTKEVLQAGYSAPSFPMQLNITSNNNEVAKIAGTNAQAVFNVVFKASNNSATSYRLKLNKSQLPSGWSANFSVAGQTFADSSKLTLAATDSQNVVIRINTGSDPNQKGSVYLEAFSPSRYSSYRASGMVTAFSKLRTAFVNKSGNSGTYLNSLSAAGTDVMQLSADEFAGLAHDGFERTNVDHVFLSTGTQFSPTMLSDKEISNLTAYLNSGGNLFISGQDIGYSAFAGGGSSAFKSFYQQYMGASYLHDGDDDGVSISSVNNEPVFGTMGTTSVNTNGFTLYSDIIAANPQAPNATPIIMYDNLNVDGYAGTTGVAAVRNNGSNWRLVYTSFLTEAISSSFFRDDFISRAIVWFDGNITSAEFDAGMATSLKAYPNPAGAQFTVTLPEVSNGTVISMVDLLGRVVLTENVPAGKTSAVINTANLNAGTYFVQVAGENTAAQKIVIVK